MFAMVRNHVKLPAPSTSESVFHYTVCDTVVVPVGTLLRDHGLQGRLRHLTRYTIHLCEGYVLNLHFLGVMMLTEQ